MTDQLSMDILEHSSNDDTFPPEWQSTINAYKENLQEKQHLQESLKKNEEERNQLMCKLIQMKRKHDRELHGLKEPPSSSQRVKKGEFTDFCEDVNSLFKCKKCGKVFKSRDTFTTHYKETHSDKKKEFPCPTCGKSFPRKFNMERHKKQHQ